MSSDSIKIERNSSKPEDLSESSNTNLSGLYSSTRSSSSIEFSSPSSSNKDDFDNEKSPSPSSPPPPPTTTTNRKETPIKTPYPVVSDHRDPSSVLVLLQKETQTTSKKILDVIQQIENCEKHLSSNRFSDKHMKSLKYERVKLKQQLDALKKHERRVNLQIDFIMTKIEIKGLEDEKKQNMNDENKQINILLGKLKQKLDKMKIYMRTRNEQTKKMIQTKQQSSLSNDNRQQHRLTSSDSNSKRVLSSSDTISHSNKRLKATTHSQTKAPNIRLNSRLSNHQSQSHSIRTPTVRFLNKTSASSMTALNSSSPTTPASSSSTLSPPLSATMGETNSIKNSLQQIEIPSIDEDDELNVELDIDELFNDDPYSEENMQEFKYETKHHKIHQDNAKKES